MTDPEKPYKLVIAGLDYVGKTAILDRYLFGTFPSHYESTIEEHYKKSLICNDDVYYVEFFDTPGREEYSEILNNHLNDASIVCLVYSIDSFESFEFAKKLYMERVRKTRPCILVANKCDLKNKAVSVEDGRELARNFGLDIFHVSTATGQGIVEMFAKGFQMILGDKYRQERPSTPINMNVKPRTQLDFSNLAISLSKSRKKSWTMVSESENDEVTGVWPRSTYSMVSPREGVNPMTKSSEEHSGGLGSKILSGISLATFLTSTSTDKEEDRLEKLKSLKKPIPVQPTYLSTDKRDQSEKLHDWIPGKQEIQGGFETQLSPRMKILQQILENDKNKLQIHETQKHDHK